MNHSDDDLVPYQGDTTYVYIQIGMSLFGCCVGLLGSSSVLSNLGPNDSQAVLALAFGLLVCLFPIEYLILKGIWYGKTWAFYVEGVLLAVSCCTTSNKQSQQLMAVVIIGAIVKVFQFVYVSRRILSMVGPPLK